MRLRSGTAFGEGAATANAPTTAAALPHDVLVRIFGLLPRGELAVTPGRVCRAWAAGKAAAWAAVSAIPQPWPERAWPFLPPYYVRETYAAATPGAKEVMRSIAATHGVLDLLAELYAVDREAFESDDDVCFAAVVGGQLQTLAWLRARNCMWSKDVTLYAAEFGPFELLKWCIDNGAPMCKFICSHAAAGGKLDALVYLREHGCEWSEDIFRAAAFNADFQMLDYCRRQRCPWSALTCAYAALGNESSSAVAVLAWLRRAGCLWDERTCSFAALRGWLEVVQFVRDSGCGWAKETCTAAAIGGHLDVLQLCRQNGCPWSFSDCVAAARRDQETIRRWHRAQRHFVDVAYLDDGRGDCAACLEWLESLPAAER
jgi:hypothetical protein